ncbi:MAG: hypothetical protein PHU21_11860, partial [Elusimicrobia bacterium]|nr:hypothetical protein [Elusimicrobiota bacterium]
MNPRSLLAASLCACLILPAPGWSAQQSPPNFDTALAQAKAAARQSFQSHRPGRPYADAVVKLPVAPEDAQKKLNLEAF